MSIADKAERNDRLDETRGPAARDVRHARGARAFAGRAKQIKAAFRALQKKLVRKRIVDEGVRIDGRGTTDIRPLSAEVDILPTAHGSGLFQRGETQVLNVTTLGMPRMEQFIGLDELRGTTKRYMHHYNFPPYSTGETGRVGSPKRREIGHGLLAERALLPVVPSMEEFPYALRLVSDVLSSNGSTSMASVCGSTLSMMDAGVPIKAPVAGIAMGLVYAEGKYTTLTDILGAEDAFGDMDFKVAGTRDFVTALQLDTKIDGLPADVLGEALLQAREARLKILDVMDAAIAEPRRRRRHRPEDRQLRDPDRQDRRGHRAQGQGHQHPPAGDRRRHRGRRRRRGRHRDHRRQGRRGRRRGPAADRADPRPAHGRGRGRATPGKVVNITKFGAFVNILPGRDGLLHISKLGRGKRIDRVEDVLDLGDEVEVRVDDIDPRARSRSSLVGRRARGERFVRRRAAVEGESRRQRRPGAARADRERRGSGDRRGGVVRGRLGRAGPGGVRRPRSGRGRSARWRRPRGASGRRWSPARRPALTARARVPGMPVKP